MSRISFLKELPSNQRMTTSTLHKLLEHPVFSDGFRVFFPLTALSGMGFILYWGLALSGVAGLETKDIDPLLLHRYDMIFGYLVAAMAGFLTTAVPAWSNTAKVAKQELAGLGLLWIAGRVAFWFMASIPAWIVFALHFLFLVALAWRVLPHLANVRMKHLAWPVLLLLVSQCLVAIGYVTEGVEVLPGFYITFDAGLAMAEGAFAIMVLTALAPISTVIVNLALEDREDGGKFLAKPPLRRAAMACIAFYTLARMGEASDGLIGWLALASACAILNILQDWHLRGAVSTIYAKALYSVYWFLAFGLMLQAAGLLGLASSDAFVAGRHMMFIGGFSLPTLMVLIIAGTRHSGHELDMPPLFTIAILCMIAACLLRSLLPLLVPDVDWMTFAWMFFAVSFASFLIQFMPWALSENADD